MVRSRVVQPPVLTLEHVKSTMSMSSPTAALSSNRPLGTGGNLRRRLVLHHVPLALLSAVVLALFMNLPLFDIGAYPHPDIVSGALPHQQAEGRPTSHGKSQDRPMHNGVDEAGPTGHDRGQSGPIGHGGHHNGPMSHAAGRTSGRNSSPDEIRHGSFIRQFTVATGYIALAFLALTLLIGPANLLLRRRVPVSNYLSRDVGAWAAIFSVVHLIVALLAHVNDGGLIASFLHFFVAPDGSLLTNSFGLGNWTGLAALVIVVGLMAISNDFALRKLKAKLWKRLQRLNYALFALVIAHAFFYGALLRATSPFTLLLGLSVIAVFVGQAAGVRLWRRRFSQPPWLE